MKTRFANTSFQTFSRMLIFALVAVTVVGIGSSIVWMQEIKALDNNWQDHEKGVSRKSVFLSLMRDSLGYGGMIHHLKNYVLRGEQDRLIEFHRRLLEMKVALSGYRDIGLTETELASLQDIEGVLDNYLQFSLSAETMVSEGIAPEQIDQRISVDDGPALTALQRLQASVFEARVVNQRAITEQTERLESILAYSAGGIAMSLFLLTIVLGLVFRHRLVRPLQDLVSAFEQIDPNKMEGARLPESASTSSNEVGLLARAGNRFLEAVDAHLAERKKAQEESRQLALFPEQNANPVLRVSSAGKILYANPAADWLLEEWTTDIGGRIDDSCWKMVRKALSTGNKQSAEVRFDDVTYLFTMQPILEFAYANIYATDITKRKKAEMVINDLNASLEKQISDRTKNLRELTKEVEDRRRAESSLRQALDELQRTQDVLIETEKMAALGNLVAGVAHEINSPLGIGVTAASHFRTKADEIGELYKTNQMKRSDLEKFLESSAQSVKILETNLRRASDLVRSFKQVAVDQSVDAVREIRLKDYLDEILMSLEPKLKKTKVAVVLDVDPGLSIRTRPGAISQIVTNLVINSLLHGFGENKEGQISVAAHAEGATVTIEYRDDGKGMDDQTMRRLFEPFFTTKRGTGGTGLGMHILYNLVTQSLGGNVTCTSAPGEGMCMVITLPMAAPQLKEHA